MELPPIIVISGAIGSGKGTIVHALAHELDLTWVATHTTRPMRRDDTALSRRTFDTETNFLRHNARGEFIESVELAGYHYGVLRHDVEKGLRHHKALILEISVEGGIALAKTYPHTLLIFLQSPENERSRRISQRHLAKNVHDTRMKLAHQEEKIAQSHYDYLIENKESHPEEAIDAIKEIIIDHFPAVAHAG